MGTVPTIKIRNKRNGKTRIINEADWAYDLGKGKYNGWERAGGERRAADTGDVVERAAQAELAKQREEAKQREAEDAARAEAEAAEADIDSLNQPAEEQQTSARRGRGRR